MLALHFYSTIHCHALYRSLSLIGRSFPLAHAVAPIILSSERDSDIYGFNLLGSYLLLGDSDYVYADVDDGIISLLVLSGYMCELVCIF